MPGPRLLLTMVLLATPVPVAAQVLRGTWDGTTYLAPDSAFAFTPPRLLARPSEPRVAEAEPDARSFLVQLGDALCRNVVVVETRGELVREPLEAWVAREVVATLDPQKVDSLTRTIRDTRFGRTVELRWVARSGAPCQEVRVSGGRMGEPVQPDADVGMLVVHLPGRFVRLVYLLGRSGQPETLEGVPRGPMPAMLEALLAGFEPVP